MDNVTCASNIVHDQKIIQKQFLTSRLEGGGLFINA